MTDIYEYFKFRRIDKYTIDSLVRPSLYFARPKDLNDPFDCSPNLRRVIEQAEIIASEPRKSQLRTILEAGKLAEEWGDVFQKVGVCSFSLSISHTLMWSHYADNHRGVCILYKMPKDFIEDTATTDILGTAPIQYGDKPFVRFMANEPVTNQLAFLNSMIPHYLSTKHRSWGYEKEARIIRGQPGLLPVPPEFIAQICFGLETPAEDIDLIRTLIRAHRHPVTIARMTRRKRGFGFAPRRLD